MEKAEKKTKKNFLTTFLIIILLLGIGTVLWARFISTKGLKIKEYAIINHQIPKSFHGLKIIHFSDLHYGRTTFEEELKEIVKTINSYKPDIVVFTGDLIDKDINIKDKDIELIARELNNIEVTIGKYGVKGNHDYEKDFYNEIMAKTDFIIFNNEKKLIYYNDENPIEIIGLPSVIKDHQDYELAFGEDFENTYYKILITHEPDIIDNLDKYDINLMLAGHSHAGQIRLPFIGAVVKNKYAKNYYDAYYKVNETDLYISSGIGTSTFSFRFLNKPSINLYRLYNY